MEACLGVEALVSSGKKHRTLGLGREIPGDGRMWKVVLPTITLRKGEKTVVFFVGRPRAPAQFRSCRALDLLYKSLAPLHTVLMVHILISPNPTHK